jgi:hypothetical protein
MFLYVANRTIGHGPILVSGANPSEGPSIGPPEPLGAPSEGAARRDLDRSERFTWNTPVTVPPQRKDPSVTLDHEGSGFEGSGFEGVPQPRRNLLSTCDFLWAASASAALSRAATVRRALFASHDNAYSRCV